MTSEGIQNDIKMASYLIESSALGRRYDRRLRIFPGPTTFEHDCGRKVSVANTTTSMKSIESYNLLPDPILLSLG